MPGLQKMLKRGSLVVEFADGEKHTFGDGSGVSVKVYVRSALSPVFLFYLGRF